TYTDGAGFTSRGDDVTALMQNENFRKALCYALDREAIASVLGSGQATNRYVASSVTGTTEGTAYVDEYELEEVAPLSGDTDAAKEYLQAALDELGYSDVSELPTITYLTFETDAQKLLAETAVSIWENDLGLTNITINLQPISSAVMSMVYMDFDIYLQQLSVNTDDELELLNYWITTGEVSDPAGFQASGVPASMASMHADEEYDALIADAYVDFDEESYFSKVAEAEQMLYSAYVYFPIQEGGSYFITQDYVEGYTYESTLDYGYSFANVVVYAH
ncbi:MAG: ABC transporter substrate-binding protein, partial [Lachnospiraceae bacterium]|nr:ABC transporter substrate-binding protein [Lachnospiraceae bacterium]